MTRVKKYMQLKTKLCDQCGHDFRESSRGQRFCSGECYEIWSKIHSEEINANIRGMISSWNTKTQESQP